MNNPNADTKERVDAYLEHFFRKCYDTAADEETRRALVHQRIKSLYEQVLALKGAAK